MKTRSNFLILLFLFACMATGFAQSVLLESRTFPSKKLGKEVSYSVYLPDGYQTSDRSYPVLYLLHGYTDDNTAWTQFGKVQQTTDRLIASGDAAPMIIIMPDAWDSWYINQYDGKASYEDMFFEELIPFVEQTYRARSQRESRAIAGLSMGGYGSFLYSLHHPEMFKACAPLSAAIFDDSIMTMRKDNSHKELYTRLFGPDDSHWKKNSVLQHLEDLDKENLPKVRYYIDCGDDDWLLPGNVQAHQSMNEKGLKHEFRVRDGGHTWSYWQTALPEVLIFVSQSFTRN